MGDGILSASSGIEVGFIHLEKHFLVKAEIKRNHFVTACMASLQRHVKIIPKAGHF